jgi:hypothetical protein
MLPGDEASVPRFVLLDERRRIGPEALPSASGLEYSICYGFSDKAMYERFRGNSPRPLTPYPLVQTFLRAEAAKPQGSGSLVAIDATGPDDLHLHAATAAAVLAAHEQKTATVVAACDMVRVSGSQAYRVEALAAS